MTTLPKLLLKYFWPILVGLLIMLIKRFWPLAFIGMCLLSVVAIVLTIVDLICNQREKEEFTKAATVEAVICAVLIIVTAGLGKYVHDGIQQSVEDENITDSQFAEYVIDHVATFPITANQPIDADTMKRINDSLATTQCDLLLGKFKVGSSVSETLDQLPAAGFKEFYFYDTRHFTLHLEYYSVRLFRDSANWKIGDGLVTNAYGMYDNRQKLYGMALIIPFNNSKCSDHRMYHDRKFYRDDDREEYARLEFSIRLPKFNSIERDLSKKYGEPHYCVKNDSLLLSAWQFNQRTIILTDALNDYRLQEYESTLHGKHLLFFSPFFPYHVNDTDYYMLVECTTEGLRDLDGRVKRMQAEIQRKQKGHRIL